MKTMLIAMLLLSTHCPAFPARVTTYTGSEDAINGSYSCTGARLHPGEVAADLSIYPLGTKLRIDGESFTVADCGSDIQGPRHFDRYCSSRSEMNRRGTQICDVEVIGREAFNSKRQHGCIRLFTHASCQYSSKRGLIAI